MPYFFNIINVKTNTVCNNGSVSFGAAVHNSHTANSKNSGISLSAGDFSPNTSWIANCVFDPDVSDQDQIANPSLPIANQL
ncbi:spore germination protein [Sutcliffiella horikoshii]|uniref:spore germination protein n=1 Tax=Sutcliffiella horikoshii TaxID=79883 RepID=UPI0007D078C9|nr:spore germination protein [Sutcliffiella horikoshii]MCM3620356.1 spore germination protein [Sutcliffiella horikoshii]